MDNKLIEGFIFWGVWIIIPLIWEGISGLISGVLLMGKYLDKKKNINLEHYPLVSILIPVYNSADTLEACLNSILKQSYPLDKIEVFLLNNGNVDRSHLIFQTFQKKHPELKIWWINTEKGKSKALNYGVLNSRGKYIINIDSDGWLDINAVNNIIRKFESNHKIAAITGVILIDIDLISMTECALLRLVRDCELFEYLESFLVGRNFQSIFNSMYTLAGACSAFRREAMIKTNLYNFITVGEDTHMTFQIKQFAKGRVVLCEDAFFYVDPIESLDKLYSQRQRWQRGQLEVGNLFQKLHLGRIPDFFRKYALRIIVSDHTLAFPRLIWIFGMLYLYYMDYPIKIIIGTNIILYILYIFNSLIYSVVAFFYLGNQIKMKKFIIERIYIVIFLPMYRFLGYCMRIAGIINSAKTETNWNRKTFSEEVSLFCNEVRKNTEKLYPFLNYFGRRINDE